MIKIDIAVLVEITGTAVTILFSYFAYQRGSKKDHTDEGKASGVILSDIGYIKAGVDDLKRD